MAKAVPNPPRVTSSGAHGYFAFLARARSTGALVDPAPAGAAVVGTAEVTTAVDEVVADGSVLLVVDARDRGVVVGAVATVTVGIDPAGATVVVGAGAVVAVVVGAVVGVVLGTVVVVVVGRICPRAAPVPAANRPTTNAGNRPAERARPPVRRGRARAAGAGPPRTRPGLAPAEPARGG